MSPRDQQRMDSLARANGIRRRRRDLKAELRTGQATLADVLLSEEPWLATMKIRDLLLTTPGIGCVRADKALRACRLSATITVGHCSRRTRALLLAWFVTNCSTADVGWEPEPVAATPKGNPDA